MKKKLFDANRRGRCLAMQNEAIRFNKLAFSIEETIGLLSIGRTTLYAKIKTGELQARKCGRKTLILADDINRFLDGLGNGEQIDG